MDLVWEIIFEEIDSSKKKYSKRLTFRSVALKFHNYHLQYVFAASMPLTKHLKVAIIDSNPALGSKVCFKKEDPPDPRVSTVTPATISLFKGINFDILPFSIMHCANFKFY